MHLKVMHMPFNWHPEALFLLSLIYGETASAAYLLDLSRRTLRSLDRRLELATV
jgi:hypothetical protein